MLRRTSTALRFKHSMASTSSIAPLIKKLERVLIANRGEIAIRIMNTAKKMNIETVAVFSDIDRNALFVKKADKAFHIGPSSAAQSYLNIDRVIETALKAGVQGIHPGYGFLSENAMFAEKCAEAGLVFIGPSSQAIRDMGTKNIAKQIMQDAKVIFKYFLPKICKRFSLSSCYISSGYPVLLKAVYGGGGKGMRIVWSESEFDEKLASARNEAMKSFSRDEMLVEKFVEKPRHVEVQVSHETRCRLGESAVRAAAAVNYVGAGTVEFIMDPSGNFYFMEMNTRLQVEHPVTEAITGTDLVEWQLRIAQGDSLPVKQSDIPLNGHAFECRVYAEDTKGGSFMPTAGKLDFVSFPTDSSRIDTGVCSGDEVSVHYDPMIAKVIVWDRDRESAVNKLDAALSKTRISGLPTNISFVRTILAHPEFIKGNVYTDFISDHQSELFLDIQPSTNVLIEGTVGLALIARPRVPNGPFEALYNFRLNHSTMQTFRLGEKDIVVSFINKSKLLVSFDNEEHVVSLSNVQVNGKKIQYTMETNGMRWTANTVLLEKSALVYGEGESNYAISTDCIGMDDASGTRDTTHFAYAPMPGIVENVLVKAGDIVKRGQPLVVMTAMKMEYVIKAPSNCSIASVSCSPGENVTKNALLIKFAVLEDEKQQMG
uniref:Methylcrotonoyl-CoA carboxylase subunit alpha, mitochondrial n=1 Tax=Heterorhabditis bacteriophora TaxID=37862 RepID=A0A1I7XS88_HETBA